MNIIILSIQPLGRF